MASRSYILCLQNVAGDEVCRVPLPPIIFPAAVRDVVPVVGAIPGARRAIPEAEQEMIKAWRFSVFNAVERATGGGAVCQRYGDADTWEPLLLENLESATDLVRAFRLEGPPAEQEVLIEFVYVSLEPAIFALQQKAVEELATMRSAKEVHDFVAATRRANRQEGNEPSLPGWFSDSNEVAKIVLRKSAFGCDHLFLCFSERLRGFEELAMLVIEFEGTSRRSVDWRKRTVGYGRVFRRR